MIVFGCNSRNHSNETFDSRTTGAGEGEIPSYHDEATKDSLLMDMTGRILKVIKAKDFSELAAYIHPEMGLRISPYGYIDTVSHEHFSRQRFLRQVKAENSLVWGSYDGTGKEIDLSMSEYFDQFVYDVDFLNAEQTSVNETLGHGNSLNNLKNVYPQADFTESYFSGFEEKYGGMDWRSLRLVFQGHEGKPYLIAIIHDQWTI